MEDLLTELEQDGYKVVRSSEGVYISGYGDPRTSYTHNYWTPELDAITSKHGYMAEWVNEGKLQLVKW